MADLWLQEAQRLGTSKKQEDNDPWLQAAKSVTAVMEQPEADLITDELSSMPTGSPTGFLGGRFKTNAVTDAHAQYRQPVKPKDADLVSLFQEEEPEEYDQGQDEALTSLDVRGFMPKKNPAYKGIGAPLAERAGKGLYNKLVSDKLKPERSTQEYLNKLSEAETRALQESIENGSINWDKFGPLKEKYAKEGIEGKGLRFDIEPPKNLAESLTDVGVGLGAFATEMMVLRGAAGKLGKTNLTMGPNGPQQHFLVNPWIWESASLSGGGKPGAGLGMSGALQVTHAAGPIKGTLLASGLFAGKTAIEGGSKEDILISAGIPIVYSLIGAGKTIGTKKNLDQATKQYRLYLEQRGIDTSKVPDAEFHKMIKNIGYAKNVESQYKGEKITQENYEKLTIQILDKTLPIAKKAATNMPVKQGATQEPVINKDIVAPQQEPQKPVTVTPPKPVVPVDTPISPISKPTQPPQAAKPQEGITAGVAETTPQIEPQELSQAGGEGATFYHGSQNKFNPEDIEFGRGNLREGIYLSESKATAETYANKTGNVYEYNIKPDAKVLDLSDGETTLNYILENGILEKEDIDVDLENYILSGRIFQYDPYNRQGIIDDVMATAKEQGYDVVRLLDDLGGESENIATVVVNKDVLSPAPQPQATTEESAAVEPQGGKAAEKPKDLAPVETTGKITPPEKIRRRPSKRQQQIKEVEERIKNHPSYGGEQDYSDDDGIAAYLSQLNFYDNWTEVSTFLEGKKQYMKYFAKNKGRDWQDWLNEIKSTFEGQYDHINTPEDVMKLVKDTVDQQVKRGVFNKKGIEAALASGDPTVEVDIMIHDMMSKRFNDDEINEAITLKLAQLKKAGYNLNSKDFLIGQENEQKSTEVPKQVQQGSKESTPTETEEETGQVKADDDFSDFFDFQNEPAKDMLGRVELQGGATGKQKEFLEKDNFKTIQEQERVIGKNDAVGQMDIFGGVKKSEPKPGKPKPKPQDKTGDLFEKPADQEAKKTPTPKTYKTEPAFELVEWQKDDPIANDLVRAKGQRIRTGLNIGDGVIEKILKPTKKYPQGSIVVKQPDSISVKHVGTKPVKGIREQFDFTFIRDRIKKGETVLIEEKADAPKPDRKQAIRFTPHQVDSITEVMRRVEEDGLTPRLKKFFSRITGHKGKEIISNNASGRQWRGNIDSQTYSDLVEATRKVYNESAEYAIKNDPKKRPGFLLLDAKNVLEALGAEPKGPHIFDFKNNKWKAKKNLPGGGGGGSAQGSPSGARTRNIKLDLEPEGKIKGRRVNKHKIIKSLSKAFHVPIKGLATHKMRSYLGKYWLRAQGIRQVKAKDIITAAHEVGHHIDNAYGIAEKTKNSQGRRINGLPKGAEAELVKLGKELYGKRKPSGGYASEGIAEYVRGYLTESIDVTKEAPKFTQWMNDVYFKDYPDIKKALDNSKELYTIYKKQGARARIRSSRYMGDIKGTISDATHKMLLKIETDWRDEFAPILRGMEKAGIDRSKLKPTEDPYFMAAVFADTAGSKARYFALSGTTDIAGNKIGPSLKEILNPVSDDIERFLDWAESAKALQLHSLGIDPGIEIPDAKHIYEKDKNDIYEKALKEWTEWNRAGLKYLVDSGAMPKEIFDKIVAKHPVYIPFQRAFEKGEARRIGSGSGKGIVNSGSPVKKIKGSDRPRVDPILSSLQNMEKMISVGQKVMVTKALARLAGEKGIADFIWEVPAPQKATQFTAEKIKKDIIRIAQEKLGLELDPDEISSGMLDTWDDLLTVFSNAEQYRGKDNIVKMKINGKNRWFEVNPDLLSVLEGLDQYTLPWYLDVVLGKPTRALRLGATGVNAAFGLVRNPIRDIATFTVLSKHAKLGPVSALSGIGQDIATQVAGIAENFGIKNLPVSRYADLFEALGGDMSVQVMHDRRGQKSLRQKVLASNGKRYTIHTVMHPVEALKEITGLTEAGTRIGEFKAALKDAEKKYGKGSADAAFYALYQGKDVTTNFTRHGKIAKQVNQVVAFFNAAIQGPDKILRTMRERPMRTIFSALAFLTLPALYLWWKNKDKEWYKEMPDYEKFGYQHYQASDDVIVRWPVPFELGHIFQTLPIAAMDAWYNENPNEVLDAFKYSAETANPFDWPSAIGPIIDVKSNEDFAGRPIVPRSVEGREKKDQYGPYTTALMKYIGKKIDMPPAQIEHLVNSYSGGMYKRLSQLFNKSDKEKIISDTPVVGTLFLKDSNYPKKSVHEFYKEKDRLDRAYQSKTINREDIVKRKRYWIISDALSLQLKKLITSKTIAEREEIYKKMNKILDRLSPRVEPIDEQKKRNK